MVLGLEATVGVTSLLGRLEERHPRLTFVVPNGLNVGVCIYGGVLAKRYLCLCVCDSAVPMLPVLGFVQRVQLLVLQCFALMTFWH